MRMKISLDPASAEEKPVVLRLLELYNYDFSEFSLDMEREFSNVSRVR